MTQDFRLEVNVVAKPACVRVGFDSRFPLRTVNVVAKPACVRVGFDSRFPLRTVNMLAKPAPTTLNSQSMTNDQ
ncbi:hypothetical protein [Scytonema millei]|uniref:Uncharacterized protein n=1 Tax=Scytonema millei VB511283 TaxID=1245923 RepID=A0A9X5E7C8_9CYAN|nr:hypothetical protein [Scytonema millei]NHC35352.1 hypothetical protein [Scytonema millei VB511283]